MKRLIILIPMILGIFFTSLNAKTIYGRSIDVDVFYGALQPYGEWIEIGYDDYVWRPYKSDYNWRPYSDGRWEWTRNGWYWVSYEPFGWATFHYGRWYYDDYYGWVWMPDNVWAPAWVEWRYNDNYIGWAPLPPYAVFNPRHGIHFSLSWHSGHFYWSFVKYNHFVSHKIHTYFVDRYYINNIYKKSKYRTNYFAENDRIVNGGVSRKYVERKIGRKLTTRQINRTENFKEFNSRDVKSTRGIVEYTPSEKTIRNSSFDKKLVKKGRELKSLKSDKIAINRRNVIKSNDNIKSETKIERNSVRKNKKLDPRKNENNGVKRNPEKKRNTEIKRNDDNLKRDAVKKAPNRKFDSKIQKRVKTEPNKRLSKSKTSIKSSSAFNKKAESNNVKSKSSSDKDNNRKKEVKKRSNTEVKKSSTNKSESRSSRSKTSKLK